MKKLLPVLLLAGLASAQPLLATPVNGTVGIGSGSLAGTDPDGRVLLFAPDPHSPGSSISHWDTSASPNLLMEPNISGDLGFQQLDLTTFQLRDTGWSNGTSIVTLRVMDGPGEGFNDPDLGSQRMTAIQRVLAVWAARLESSVEINVEVEFDTLDCDNQGAVLAQAGANFLFESFAGAPFAGTWYHGALAEALSGQNLSLEDVADPNAGDLGLMFNSRIDEGCLGGSSFYYGLDANVPNNQISFINVALHEMAHGLGFSTFANSGNGNLFLGMPDIYNRFTFDNTQGKSWHRMSTAERRQSATSGNVVWSGNRVTSQAPNFLQSAPVLRINSPASIAGEYTVGTAAFGPQLTRAGITGELVIAVDNSSSPELLCGPVVNAAEVAGNIAVVDRGQCNFTEKVRNAQTAGAVAVVVINNVAGPPIAMGGNDANVTIPSVMITSNDGDLIKDTLAQTGDPGSLTFNAATFSVAEGAGEAIVRVRRSGGTVGRVTVDYATAGGSATAGEDYVPASGTVTWNDGQGGTQSFQIAILDDGDSEGEETVDLVLSNATGASLGATANAVLAIEDDDLNEAGFIAFGAPEVQVRESEGRATVTVVRTGGATGAVSADYATGGGSATAGDDYVAANGSVSFADGEDGTKSFVVEILDDDDEESIETLGLALSNPTGGALLGTPSSSIVEIVDDEACQADDTRLCLNQGRFRVEITWRDFNDTTGSGQVVTASDDSGLVWFFNADNWEMLIKVLDGCGVNGHFWVFAAATTNVEYTLTVTDTLTGNVKEYVNPLGSAAQAITDTGAFATCDGSGILAEPRAEKRSDATRGMDAPAARTTLKGQAGADCVAGESTLCLNQGRFQVEVDWADFQGGTGPGREVDLGAIESIDSGLLYFFNADNWEMLIKVLDGCGINDHFWVFAAATTNVEYTLTVTDTDSGEVRRYANPLGSAAAAITDTEAFMTCP